MNSYEQCANCGEPMTERELKMGLFFCYPCFEHEVEEAA